MATYFNTGSADDLNLLPSGVRTHAELDNVVEQVEAEVLRGYRVWDGTAFRVMLYGADDGDAAAWKAEFAEAMRLTVADVAGATLADYDGNPLLESESLDGYSYKRARGSLAASSTVHLRWPSNWSHRLTRFDIRTRLHTI